MRLLNVVSCGDDLIEVSSRNDLGGIRAVKIATPLKIPHNYVAVGLLHAAAAHKSVCGENPQSH